MPANFREHLLPSDDARVTSLRGLDAREYAEVAKSDSFAGPMIAGWATLYPEPFVGITTDGHLIEGLYRVATPAADEAAPTADMVAAANVLLGTLSEDLRTRVGYAIDAHEWRSWANPEFMQHDTGLRLDEQEPRVREAILGVLEASLSPDGYELARTLMRINGFLGDIVGLPKLMNEFSYNFSLYGVPSLTEPWGWQLFGHHVAINCAVVGQQMVVSPVFFGAEPDTIDEGEFAGVRVFDKRIRLARALMESLTTEQRARAVSYERLVDPEMPEGRIHPGDERHLGGAFQDNRVIPYEGIRVSDLDSSQQELIRAILADFVSYLPAGPAAARLREIESFFGDSWFSWIGGWSNDEPFYFRFQSPVVMVELDHHCGVFLGNREPAAFHIHTVIRTPNGNDYGRTLVEAALGRPLER